MTLTSILGPHTSSPMDEANALFHHLAVGWLDTTAIAVCRRWAEFLVLLLPDMLVASHRASQIWHRGWLRLNNARLRATILRAGLLPAFVADCAACDELGVLTHSATVLASLLDRVLGSPIVELSFQPWLESCVSEHLHAAGGWMGDEGIMVVLQDGVPLCSVRQAGAVDIPHVLQLIEGDALLINTDWGAVGWILGLQGGFSVRSEELHTEHPSVAFDASRAFRRCNGVWELREAHEMAAEPGPDFVGWLRATHPAAAPAVLQHLLERYAEWIDHGKQFAVRWKAIDAESRQWLPPHQMVRLLCSKCPLYNGPVGAALLAAELKERLAYMPQ